MPGPNYNLLVISDTHLGEEIKDHTRIEYLKQMAELDRDLCNFLEYYARHTRDDRPWKLVINGDFLDFLTVTVRPSERAQENTPLLKLDTEEQVYGVSATEDRAVWKLERIVERHHLVMTYLADFVGHGHQLEILYGNHDPEMYWPQVKAAFRDTLVQIYFGTEAVPGVTEDEYGARIRFHEWFYYEPGKVYIEHGNQYDDFSSFEYRLCQIQPDNSDDLAMPVSQLVIRYFVNTIEGFTTHNKDNWTLGDYISWLTGKGWHHGVFILKSYVRLSKRLLRYSKQLQEADHSQIEATHHRRMKEEAERYDMPLATAQQVDALHTRPVHYATGTIVQGLDIDTWGFAASYLLLLVIVLLLPGWGLTLVGLCLWMALLTFRQPIQHTIRRRFLGGLVARSVEPKLDTAAKTLAQVLDVRLIVMGHTHRPLVRQVREDPPCWYVNSGAWIVPEVKERHLGTECQSPLTYVVIQQRALPEATLLRWCQRAGHPVPFDETATGRDDESEAFAEPSSSASRSRVTVDVPETPPEATRPSLRKRRY